MRTITEKEYAELLEKAKKYDELEKNKKEELIQIATNLKSWAKKYNKNYVSVFMINNTVHANITREDEEYEDLNINI